VTGNVEGAPVRQMKRQQRPKETAVRRHAQVQQLMSDDKILELGVLLGEIRRQRDRSRGRARAPFPNHPLDANDARRDFQPCGPNINPPLEGVGCLISPGHPLSAQ
jgi:hypothetical protein